MDRVRSLLQRDSGLILDVLQSIIAFSAAIALALDSFGLVDLPWLRQNLLDIIFVAVCALIIVSVLERRSTLQSFHAETNKRLEKVELHVADIKSGLSGYISGDLFLKDRSQYEPLEKRIKQAKEVHVIGRSLVGFVGMHHHLIRLEAKRGCVFRFIIICDPSIYQDGPQLSQEVNWTHTALSALEESFPDKIDIRLLKPVLHCSILAIDYKTEHGIIQVELYPSVREVGTPPHFELTPTREPKWYKYYREQIELLWETSYSTPQNRRKLQNRHNTTT